MSEFHSDEHRRLAGEAIDPVRRMSGEPAESTRAEEIEHWIANYTELTAYKDRLLADMHKRLPSMELVAAAEVRGIDIAIIRRQLARYEERLAFWQARAAQVGRERQFTSPKVN